MRCKPLFFCRRRMTAAAMELAGTWAVFPCVGPLSGAMQALQKRVISEWLPSSGYEYAAAPDIEVYLPGDQSAPDYRSEVWLPIVKAK